MRFIFVVMVLVLFSVPVLAAPGAGEVRAGNTLYFKGKFQEALEYYEKALQKNPVDPRIEYDMGAAAYKAGEHDTAIEHFQKALLTDDDKFRRDVHFNLGDAFYRSGIDYEQRDIDQAVKRLESSLVSFEKARALDLKDQQAIENYEFVKKELERLKQKKQQQKQQKQQQQQKDQQDQQQQQQQQQQQDQEQQKDQDEQKPGEQKDQEQEDQEKKDEEKPGQEDQDQQDKPQDQSGQQQDEGQPDDPRNDQNNGASGQTAEGQISSQEDANDMVDDFERNEMPKGLLNFIHRSQETRPVDKDW